MVLSTSQFQAQNTVKGEAIIKLQPGYEMGELQSRMIDFFGINGDFRASRCLIPSMDIWLVQFDEDVVDLSEALSILRHDMAVSIAQPNHIITERLIPDDPFFTLQWHHEQSGDHDIDTPQAWDITTGGSTALGHDIVVCVVEIGGAKWNTADIMENHWINVNEIAGNGIDDDSNGYIDDVDGWNAQAGNDNLAEGDHGTRVSSMIGSKGNNTLGVTGVNWDVKLMQVQIGGSNEAAAIEGYAYPLAMRRLFNQTGGSQGAFVVATNSSWGTDNGQPTDAPLWCAMYDSLGSEGVLSCGSTTNNNVNVDEVGDLPTACPSEFMISVARTNSEDIRAGGGYGITTIDLAAPGDAVYLANNTSYGNTTGTSFSSPCVAGAIALLYSAPCTSIAEQSLSDPVFAALQMRDVILEGVDATDQLLTEMVSGGRLNVWNSLQQILNSCDNSVCTAPFGIALTPLTSNQYSVSWNSAASSVSFALRYRSTGSADWTNVAPVTSPYTLTNLEFCVSYEVQVMSFCSTDSSSWSDAFIFLSDGCCEHPQGTALSSNYGGEVTLVWPAVLASSGYTVVIIDSSGQEVFNSTVTDTTITASNLLPCSDYSAYVYSICVGFPAPPVPLNFTTAGCIDCGQLEMCTASASSNDEYIQLVNFENINRQSGSDNGYIFVEDQTTTVLRGSTYGITLEPGFLGSQYNENFRVWIDFNSDGVFDDATELCYDAPSPTQLAITGAITIPQNAALGSVRMRVGMAYTPSTGSQEPESCGVWNFGEVEDYCIVLSELVGINQFSRNELQLYPIPADDRLYCQGAIKHWRFHDTTGREVFLNIDARNGMTIIDTESLPVGLYFAVGGDGNQYYQQAFIIE